MHMHVRQDDTMQAIQLTKYGKPEEGLRFVEIAEPGGPQPGQVVIRVEYAPINDSDLLVASRLLHMLWPVAKSCSISRVKADRWSSRHDRG
jgi:NADPH:quinone reductase-like Zn-dependent oxidoreductase